MISNANASLETSQVQKQHSWMIRILRLPGMIHISQKMKDSQVTYTPSKWLIPHALVITSGLLYNYSVTISQPDRPAVFGEKVPFQLKMLSWYYYGMSPFSYTLTILTSVVYRQQICNIFRNIFELDKRFTNLGMPLPWSPDFTKYSAFIFIPLILITIFNVLRLSVDSWSVLGFVIFVFSLFSSFHFGSHVWVLGQMYHHLTDVLENILQDDLDRSCYTKGYKTKVRCFHLFMKRFDSDMV